MLREVARLPGAEIAALRAQPSWAARVEAAHTVARELRVIPERPFDPLEAARVTVPTLLLTGADSRDPSAAEVGTVAARCPTPVP